MLGATLAKAGPLTRYAAATGPIASSDQRRQGCEATKADAKLNKREEKQAVHCTDGRNSSPSTTGIQTDLGVYKKKIAVVSAYMSTEVLS
jgi:hypothetical protein